MNSLQLSSALGVLLEGKKDFLSPSQIDKILLFFEIVARENQTQNLTRLITPQDFFEGHVLDVIQLLEWGKVQFPAMDLGSGVGVPGLLAALISPDRWVLAESEKLKGDYLQRAVLELGLDSHVRVFSDRGEQILKKNPVDSVVVRAVGNVEKMYSWLHKSLTWKNLILFKGPGWDEEWKKFRNSRWKDELELEAIHHYKVGTQKKSRVLIKLVRCK